MKRHELSEAHWERLQQFLPPYKPQVGRPNHDHRRIITGILWILKKGAPWRDVPERYGPWQTVASRFYRWQKAGIWDRILAVLQQQADARGDLDWAIHFVDGTIVRAHQHAAGAKKGTRQPGARQETGRVEHQGASAGRRQRQAIGDSAHAWPAA